VDSRQLRRRPRFVAVVEGVVVGIVVAHRLLIETGGTPMPCDLEKGTV
jgi:hypothetical protein